MKKVDKIRNSIDKFYVQQALAWVEQIRCALNIPKDETIYTLEGDDNRSYFLHKNTLIIADITYPQGLKNDSDIYTGTMLCYKPKTVDDIEITAIKENNEEKYTKEEMLAWLNSPCVITEAIDVTNLEVVRFLQQYNEAMFKINRYQFYVKRDDDYSFSYNIYAKDLRTNNIFKIYVEMTMQLKTVMPKSSRDVFVYDLSGKATKYQINQCKKAFMDFIKKEYTSLKVNNFFALELIKQAIQPVEQDWGRFVNVVFPQKETGIAEIYVDDFLVFDENPYFVVENKSKKGRKTAVIDFYSANYKTTGIYKNAHNKSLFWQLNEEEIKQITDFFKLPYSDNNQKTNWKYLIEKYNKNTGELHGEEIPSDLIMPDYTGLIEKGKQMQIPVKDYSEYNTPYDYSYSPDTDCWYKDEDGIMPEPKTKPITIDNFVLIDSLGSSWRSKEENEKDFQDFVAYNFGVENGADCYGFSILNISRFPDEPNNDLSVKYSMYWFDDILEFVNEIEKGKDSCRYIEDYGCNKFFGWQKDNNKVRFTLQFYVLNEDYKTDFTFFYDVLVDKTQLISELRRVVNKYIERVKTAIKDYEIKNKIQFTNPHENICLAKWLDLNYEELKEKHRKEHEEFLAQYIADKGNNL